MASISFIPHAFQPVGSNHGVNTSYTVPVNKYAIVSVALNTVLAQVQGSVQSSGTKVADCINKSFKEQLILKSGDVLNYSIDSSATDRRIASITLNGVVFCRLVQAVSAYPDTKGGTSAPNAIDSYTANFSWEASEYSNIT
jgi:hypothetical protein